MLEIPAEEELKPKNISNQALYTPEYFMETTMFQKYTKWQDKSCTNFQTRHED